MHWFGFSYWSWLNWCSWCKQGCTLVEVRCSLWAAVTVEDTWPDHHHEWEKYTLDLLENQRQKSFWWFTILVQIALVISSADLTSLLIWGWWSSWNRLASIRWDIWPSLVGKVLTALNDGWRLGKVLCRDDCSCRNHSWVKNQRWKQRWNDVLKTSGHFDVQTLTYV